MKTLLENDGVCLDKSDLNFKVPVNIAFMLTPIIHSDFWTRFDFWRTLYIYVVKIYGRIHTLQLQDV